jgi:hypothetical protein
MSILLRQRIPKRIETLVTLQLFQRTTGLGQSPSGEEKKEEEERQGIARPRGSLDGKSFLLGFTKASI